MAGPSERRLRQASGDRSWAALAPGTRRRWIGAYGGPRSLPAAERARRAELAYQSGVHLPSEHTGHVERHRMRFRVATTAGIVVIETANYRHKSRLGAFAHDSGLLLGDLRDRNGQPLGAMSEAAFRRRWGHRVRTVTDEASGRIYTLEKDPRRVRALWAAAAGEEGAEAPVSGRTP